MPWLASCGSSSVNCWPEVGFPEGVDWGPYVALPTTTSMLVVWRSEKRVVGRVEAATADGMRDPPFGEVLTFEDEGPRRRHVIRLTGLEPGMRYAYWIQHDGELVGRAHHFRAQAEAESWIRFAVVGDSGSGCPPQFDVVKVMRDMDPKFVLHVGDLVYNRPTEDRIRSRHFWPFADLINCAPLYPTWGNHDVKGEGWQRMQEAFYAPTNDVDGTESFYSFERGPCRFVVVNTANVPYHAGSPQAAWLDRELAKPARWKIVSVHNPPYTSHWVPSAADVRKALVPIFDRHRVDVVFSGDAHFYERTFPIRGANAMSESTGPDYENPRGTIYITTGGGGGELYPLGDLPLRAAGKSVYHALQVDVEPGSLSVYALDRYGRNFDTVRIRKSG